MQMEVCCSSGGYIEELNCFDWYNGQLRQLKWYVMKVGRVKSYLDFNLHSCRLLKKV